MERDSPSAKLISVVQRRHTACADYFGGRAVWVQQVGCGVQALTFARDGRTLSTLDAKGRLIAWDTSTRAKREIAQKLWWSNVRAESFLELPCGRLVIEVGEGFSLVDPESGQFTIRTPLSRHFVSNTTQVLADGRAFFQHTSRRVISGMCLITGAELPPLEVPVDVPHSAVHALSVAPDGRAAFVLVARVLGYFLFDITPDNRLIKREPHAAVIVSGFDVPQFAPDGRTVVLMQSFPQPELTVWDIERREARGKPVAWAGGEVRIAFNPVLPLFAVPHTANTVAVRSLETGELVRELDFALGKQITALAFAPDGLTCAVGGTNKRFAVFDVDV